MKWQINLLPLPSKICCLLRKILALVEYVLGYFHDNQDTISTKLGVGEKYNLAAMIAIGYPAHSNQKSHRKHINDFILKTIGG